MALARPSNWDPLLLISQIVSIQALHYLTLAFVIPPLLALFAESTSLSYEGGAANVGMVMDWREMAGRATVRGLKGAQRWDTLTGVWSGGQQIGHSGWQDDDQWRGRLDPMRGWVIAACWMFAFSADVYFLYHFVRRPRLILDFALTLVFNHLVFTTYYSASLPTSLFFWLVMLAGSALMIIVGEQLCVKREMSEGLAVPPAGAGVSTDDVVDEVEMGTLLRRD